MDVLNCRELNCAVVQNYQIDIKDMKQPLLLSMPKARDRRRGQDTPLCFLPELCYLTGLYLALPLQACSDHKSSIASSHLTSFCLILIVLIHSDEIRSDQTS